MREQGRTTRAQCARSGRPAVHVGVDLCEIAILGDWAIRLVAVLTTENPGITWRDFTLRHLVSFFRFERVHPMVCRLGSRKFEGFGQGIVLFITAVHHESSGLGSGQRIVSSVDGPWASYGVDSDAMNGEFSVVLGTAVIPSALDVARQGDALVCSGNETDPSREFQRLSEIIYVVRISFLRSYLSNLVRQARSAGGDCPRSAPRLRLRARGSGRRRQC